MGRARPQRPRGRTINRRLPLLSRADLDYTKRLIRLYPGSALNQRLPNSYEELDRTGRKDVASHKDFIDNAEAGVMEHPALPSHNRTAFRNVMVNLSQNNAQASKTAGMAATRSNVKLARLSTPISFTPLPPLLSVVSRSATLTLESHIEAPTLPVNASPGESTSNQEDYARISTPMVVLIAVGAVCLLLGVGIILKIRTKPRRKPRIKPSLPILEKGFSDEDDFGTQDSPMFGGKERLTVTENLGNEIPLWTWVQYAKPDLTEPIAQAITLDEHASGPVANPSLKIDNQFLPHIPDAEVQRPRKAASPPRNRVSYPSLRHGGNYDPTGLSFNSASQATSFTGDGHRAIQRYSRTRDIRRSQSYTSSRGTRRRDSAYRPDSAYEGADVSSPPAYYQPISTPTIGFTPSAGAEGRARIQSSYYATGTYPRVSSVPVTYSIDTATTVKVSQAQAQTISKNRTSTGGNDDKPMLGLIYSDVGSPTSSYASASPQPTLCPDDSLSVMISKRSKRSSQSMAQNKRASKGYDADGPSAFQPSTSRAPPKGLLEMEFDVSHMSLSDIAGPSTGSNHEATYRSVSKPGIILTEKRTNDKPPRVPSPPSLPSLAQMALAHSNPDSYSDYRSPTYSIYGMYDDRKNAVTR